jgi:hypothetical protein
MTQIKDPLNNYIDNPDKGAHDSAAWSGKWTSERYTAKKRANFEAVDSYLSQPVGKLLDIGCGFAHESRCFGEKYGTELWLLDGNQKNNVDKSNTASYGKWNTTTDDLYFYHTFDFLDAKLQELGTKNYHLIDTNNINIDENIKFDLITSWLSCGHHYPVKTYIDLMKKHSHKDTRIILDIRCKGTKTNFIGVDGFEVVGVVSEAVGKKRATVEIKLI